MKGSDWLIYRNVKKICEEKGISISQLEKESGLGNGTIGGWRTSAPRLDSLQAVAKVLKVKVDKLLRE